MSADARRARCGRSERRKHPNQSCFTGAVRAKQSEDFALVNAETDAVHGHKIAEAFRDAFHDDGVHFRFVKISHMRKQIAPKLKVKAASLIRGRRQQNVGSHTRK